MSHSEISPEVQYSIDVLFDTPSDAIVLKDGKPEFDMITPFVPALLQSNVDLAIAGGDSYIPYVGACDLYHRNIFTEEELEQQLDSDNPVGDAINEMNELGTKLGNDLITAKHAMAYMAENVYLATLSRPKGLNFPTKSRLHRADMKDSSSELLAELTRHRINFVAAKIRSSEPSKKHLGIMADLVAAKDQFAAIGNYLESSIGSTSRSRVVLAMSQMMFKSYAESLQPLVVADPDEVQTARAQILDRSFDIINERGGSGIVAVHNEVSVPDAVMKHIIEGDNRGGGHMLAELNPDHIVVLEEYGNIDGGVRRSAQHVPVARVAHRSGKEVVTTFFPQEWSRAEVVQAITAPERLLLERPDRNDPTAVIQAVEHRGITMKRVLNLYPDGTPEVATAFPSAPIPHIYREIRVHHRYS